MRRSLAASGIQTPATDSNMLTAGIDIIPDRKNVGTKRAKRGECVTCGNQTHQVRGIFGKNKPLTIEGLVYKGRCLICQPLEGYIRRTTPTPSNGLTNSPPAVRRGSAAIPARVPQHQQQQQQQQQQQVPHNMQPGPPLIPHVDRDRTSYHNLAPQHQQQQMAQQQQMTTAAMPPQLTAAQSAQLYYAQNQQQLPQGQLPSSRDGEPPVLLGRTLEVKDYDNLSVVSGITLDHPLIMFERQYTNTNGRLERPSYPSDDEDVNGSMPPPITKPRPDASEDNPGAPALRPPRAMPSYEGGSSRNVGLQPRPQTRGAGPSTRRMHLPPSSNAPSRRFLTSSRNVVNIDQQQYGQEEQYTSQRGFQQDPYDRQPRNVDDYGKNIGPNFNDNYGYETKQPARAGDVQGLDEDGYPDAGGNVGWDKEAEFLPPGGYDALFQHGRRPDQGAEVNDGQNRLSPKRDFGVGGGNEIEFSPVPVPGPEPTYSRAEHDSHDNSNPPARQNYESEPQYPRQANKLQSIEDLPSFKLDNKDTAPPAPLDHHVSGPANRFTRSRGLAEFNAAALPTPSLQMSRTTGPDFISSKMSEDSDLTPLPRRGRGRPDNDVIQDPQSVTQTPNTLTSTDKKPSPFPQRSEQSTRMGGASDDNMPVMPDFKDPSAFHEDARIGASSIARRNTNMLPDAMISQGVATGTPVPRDRSPVPSDHHHPDPYSDQNHNMYHGENNKVADVVQSSTPDREPKKYAQSTSASPPPQNMVPDMMRPQQVSNVLEPMQTRPKKDKKKRKKKLKYHEIPNILHCLNLQDSSSTVNLRETGLRNLTEILWSSGDKGRDFVVQHKGIDTLVKVMWADMDNSQVLDAATDFLFALAASRDGLQTNDLLANEDSVCDSLLFAMQMHGAVESIQLKALCILACLASASSNNVKVSDGTLSGANLMVLNSMSNHMNSIEIQKAGMNALYNQCVFSVNAESVKRNLIESRVDSGRSGLEVVINSMQTLQDDIVAIEWGCKVCWCLASSEDLVRSISESPLVLDAVMEASSQNLVQPDAAAVVEACFGVLGNLAHVETNLAELQSGNAIAMLVDGMRYHPQDHGVNMEACTAIANLCVSPEIRGSAVDAGGIEILLNALQCFPEDSEFVSEATRALVCLSLHSEESKEGMARPEVVTLLVRLSARHHTNTMLQGMCCSLLAAMALIQGASDIIVDSGGVEVILRCLSSSTDEKWNDAACIAFRNLSCQMPDTDPLTENGAVQAILKAMQVHENCLSIQLNGCCAIWNLAFKTDKSPGTVVGSDGVQCIVKGMQGNMESGELLEMACGALWSLVDDCLERKKDFVASGAIDAVACAVFMHPGRTSTLEQACGVLANISSEGRLAEDIANAQGFSIVVETLRNDTSSLALLELGCMALRNIAYQSPEYAQEASPVISTIINALKENEDSPGFQEEACNLLWILAAEAENCQSKILALDGSSVLVKCLDSEDANVQAAAKGAFFTLQPVES